MTNILLIEDNAVDRFIAERQLALSGLEATMQSVTNGKSALDLLVSQFLQTGFLPDVILVDYFMPFMNGLDFIRAFSLLEMHGKETIRMFLLTSQADPGMMLDPALYRTGGIIEKPITAETLREVVKQVNSSSRPAIRA